MINLSQNGLAHDEIIKLLKTDWLGNMKYRIDLVRGGTPIQTLEYEKASYKCDSNAEVKYAGNVLAEGVEINSNLDFIQPVMYIDDGDRFEFPFVPLKIISRRYSISHGQKKVAIEAMDISHILQNPVGKRLYVEAGTAYTAKIADLVRGAGFKFTNITPSDKSLLTDREDWEENDSIISIINNMAKEINYRSLEIGLDGVPRVQPYVKPRPSNITISYVADENSIIFPDKQIETDSWGKPNIFIASVFTPEMEEPIRVEYENTNPVDPTSTSNNPYKIRTILTDIKNIADYETLFSTVVRRAGEISRSFESGEMFTSIMPHHEVGEVISVKSNGIVGVWEETSWSIDNFAPGGRMTHNLRRMIL